MHSSEMCAGMHARTLQACTMVLLCRAAPRLLWFDRVLADVGDGQSLQQSLSTFSGHVRRLRLILAAVTPASLALLDEVGSGTVRACLTCGARVPSFQPGTHAAAVPDLPCP